jgi:hypothetical protein
MKITELQLKQIIHEEAQSILEADGYLSKAVDYGTALSQPQDLRFGKGIASSATTEEDKFPGWKEINQAFNAVWQQLSALKEASGSKALQIPGVKQQLENLITLIGYFLKNHPFLELSEELLETIRPGQIIDQLQSIINMVEYVEKNIPTEVEASRPKIYEYITELLEYIHTTTSIWYLYQNGDIYNLDDAHWPEMPEI